jgi:hypothetical protein
LLNSEIKNAFLLRVFLIFIKAKYSVHNTIKFYNTFNTMSISFDTSTASIINGQEKAALESFDIGTRSEQLVGNMELFQQSISSIEENDDEDKFCPQEQLKRESHGSFRNILGHNHTERRILTPTRGAASKDVRDYKKLPTLATKQSQDCKPPEAVRHLEILDNMRRVRKAPGTIM